MAKSKKHFIIGLNEFAILDNLPNDLLCELIKMLSAYLKGQEIETDNVTLKIAFESIKKTIKTESGKASANKGYDKSDLIYPFDSDEFKNAWSNFLEYKKLEFKESYRSIKTEQAALHGLMEKSKNNEANAILIIKRSIENKWRGLFELKHNYNGSNQTGEKRQQSIDRATGAMEKYISKNN